MSCHSVRKKYSLVYYSVQEGTWQPQKLVKTDIWGIDLEKLKLTYDEIIDGLKIVDGIVYKGSNLEDIGAYAQGKSSIAYLKKDNHEIKRKSGPPTIFSTMPA